MRPLTAEELCALMNGAENDGFARRNGEFTVTSVCTDTRKIVPGCLFVPLAGERFDGHDFLAEALDKGAAGALSARPEDNGPRIVSVPDTMEALRRLAAAYKATLNVRTVAVTGSVGKTTTKEMTAAALSAGFRTQKTAGNFNNEIGVPLTLLSIGPGHEAAVVEMGMSARGEISRLSRMARPDAAVITNIGTAHIEYLGSREEIARAKFEVRDGMKQDSVLVLNGDDKYLFGAEETQGFRTVYYGVRNPEASFRAEDLRRTEQGTAFRAVYPGGSVELSLAMAGDHMVYDALAALAAAVSLGVNPALAAKSISGVSPEGMRQRICAMGDVKVILDCYNANPDSMRAALKVLSGQHGRRVALLGDMLELGYYAERSHTEAGELAAACCDVLVAVGRYADCTADGARRAGMPRESVYTPERSNAADLLYGILRPGDTVLVKGSRGMKMEEIIADCGQKLDHTVI